MVLFSVEKTTTPYMHANQYTLSKGLKNAYSVRSKKSPALPEDKD
jgi:hypothetical protein